jgi:signal transduction histidine kinase
MQRRAENTPLDPLDWDGERSDSDAGTAHSDGGRVLEIDASLPGSWEGEAGIGSNEILLREILENLSQGVAVYDADGCLFAWNQSMQDLFDLPDSLMKAGTNWHAIAAFLANRGDYGDGDPERLTEARLAVLIRDHSEPVELQLRNDLHYEVISRPLHGGARLITFYDITKQKRAEAKMKAQRDELARSNLMKDKLFSIVAHDLRSPFNTLLGFAQLIADHAERATRQELGDYAREINRSGSRLLQLVDNLLRWSCSQMGDTKFQASDQMLSPIVHGVTELQRKIAEEKGITLHTDLTDDFVSIDRDMIESLLRNLVSNAIKFTKPGGEVTIQVKPLGEDGEDRIEILVKDSGVGIGAEQLDSLFEFTDRQSTTGTLGEPGTGLGLQICSEFAAAHGSKIHVESELDAGSTFSFTVPKAV